jgi:hypothetical protein
MNVRMLYLALALMVSAGCVGPEIRPASDAMAKVHRIYVVPMESPPFVLNEWSVATENSNGEFVPPPPEESLAAQGAAYVLQVLAQIPSKPPNAEALVKDAQSKLDALPVWYPTIDLSRQAAQQLSKSGRAATAISEVQALPKAEAGVLRGAWEARVVAWYDNELPSTAYAGYKENALIAEVGISAYTAFAGKLFMQVHVRLIDAKSGELIGRTRLAQMQMPPLPPLDQAFANEGKQFKEIVTRTGNLLVLQCLKKLKLMPSETVK